MGPVCWAKQQADNDRRAETGGMIVDLPFDGVSMDIRCERRGNTIHVNIPQHVVHHSPDGFEWGYGGSGPADFALNILDLFAPELPWGAEPVECYRGRCSQFAWDNHQAFKRDFVAALPREGGVIHGATIRSWISIVRGGQLVQRFMAVLA